MNTNCKLIIGYTDHMGYWNTTEEYYRHFDGYTEAILPLLQEYTNTEKGVDITAMNKIAKHDSHKFEKIEDGVNFGNTNYMYYIDQSNRAKIRCNILSEDDEMYEKYHVMNYKVEQELTL